jgi:hypothetical protein
MLESLMLASPFIEGFTNAASISLIDYPGALSMHSDWQMPVDAEKNSGTKTRGSEGST